MYPLTPENAAQIIAELTSLNKQAMAERLSNMDDTELWSLFQYGFEDALVTLFKKYHRQIVVLVYARLSGSGNITLSLVQDAFGDFVEKILMGHFAGEVIKENFTAFCAHHLSYLVRSRARLAANARVKGLDVSQSPMKLDRPHLRVEQIMDFNRIIDLIPNITNKVYRKVLYLILVLGYNSRDLANVFGQPEKAYDKRSRAMKAFRQLLEKEGILDELR